MSLAICIHKFFKLGGILNFEEDFFSILTNNKRTWLLTLRLSCSAAGALAIQFYKLIMTYNNEFCIKPPKMKAQGVRLNFFKLITNQIFIIALLSLQPGLGDGGGLDGF